MAERIQKAPGHWSDIGDMPDAWDKKNLQALIKKFERRRFKVENQVISGKTFIELCVAEARRSHQLNGAGALLNPRGLKSKESDARVRLSLPVVLEAEISMAYPSMFKNDRHHEWFIKNFPQFRVI